MSSQELSSQELSSQELSTVMSTNPRTAERRPTVARPTTEGEVARIAAAAAAAAGPLESAGRSFRAGLLESIADELESRRPAIVETADWETAIGTARLNGELTRTVFQLRVFATVLRDGGYLEATIDRAGDTTMGPAPDLRRMLVPIGPVAVFGASNFPLAFSVPGGDTASALAAGCPVIVKAHDSHPATSMVAFDAMTTSADRVGAPAGTLGMVFGQAAGGALVADPRVKAVGFTGSLAGGQALMAIIGRREEPIPFYGELSSVNPLIITPGAAKASGSEIAAALFTSFTTAAGQLCTKPGLAFVPVGDDGDALVAQMCAAATGSPAPALLNERISKAYSAGAGDLKSAPGVDAAAEGMPPKGPGFGATVQILTTDAAALNRSISQECFGPVIVVVRYRNFDDLYAAFDQLPASLTATIHSDDSELELTARLTTQLRGRAGRLIYNGYPTGVTVAWGQHHGGPWPSTNTLHTSVGPTAIRRFLRPVTWQNAPQSLLPNELREDDPGIPRRVDGRLVTPG